MGIGSTMGSISSQEDTGAAFVLVPSAVKISLTPISGSPGDAPGQPQVQQSQSSETTAASADDSAVDKYQMARGLVKIGAAAALSQARPLEKKVETSSSSRSYMQSDGTRVTETSGTSVGMSVNPAALLDVMDILFQ